MKPQNPIVRLATAILAAIVCLIAFAATATAAQVRKEILTATVAAGETTATFNPAFAGGGAIVTARLITPDTASTATLALHSYNGLDIGNIQIAAETKTTTGTLQLTSLESTYYAGEMRTTVTTSAAPDEDLEFKLLLFLLE